MEQIYTDFEKTIKTKHSFGWTPKYKTTIETTIKRELVTEVASKVFEKLGWDVIHMDVESTEARRKNSYRTWTEKITIRATSTGKIEIESVALGNEMWDLGRNSKRVKLFEFGFKTEEKTYDSQKQEALQKEVQRRNNWEDYIVPENLTVPIKRMEPTFAIPSIGGLLVSIICALIVAYVSVNGIYIIGLFEALVGIAFGFSLKYLIRWGNFTDMEKLTYLIYAMVAAFFFGHEFFQYEIIISENNIADASFIDFIKYKFENGLKIKSLNTGWIGLLISWIFQVAIIYCITLVWTVSALVVYQMERTPPDVVDFAYYHFVKGKSENEVRQELNRKGWTDHRNQTEVIESIGAIGDRQEIIRGT
jgi:hypothetical protein